MQGQLNQLTQNDGNYLGTNLLSGQANNNLVINFNTSNTGNITIAAVDTSQATYQPAAASGSTLGSYSSYITARQNFTSQLSAIFTTGANNITAADMNQESADMLALQTQQQLGVTALSVANQANQSVLRLFGA